MAQLASIHRSFLAHGQRLEVLRGVDLTVAESDRLVITGPSGAGKSTLLAVLGMIDEGYEGAYRFEGEDVRGAGASRREGWRLRRLGFAFQDLHLVPSLTAAENVMVPAVAAGAPERDARERAVALLGDAGLGARVDHRPGQLSGGERRRVAFARALANRPRLLLVDEPTSELDAASAAGILALLDRASSEGAATVAVSHDERVLRWGRRALRLEGGQWTDPGATATNT